MSGKLNREISLVVCTFPNKHPNLSSMGQVPSHLMTYKPQCGRVVKTADFRWTNAHTCVPKEICNPQLIFHYLLLSSVCVVSSVGSKQLLRISLVSLVFHALLPRIEWSCYGSIFHVAARDATQYLNSSVSALYFKQQCVYLSFIKPVQDDARL